MPNTLKIARGLKANLPVLSDGQLYFCRDTGELYVGNNGNRPLILAGTTELPGMVKLNDSVSSTSTVEAATSNAVRMAYEAAIAASGASGAVTFDDLLERKDVTVSVVFNADGSINETVTGKTSGKLMAARKTTFGASNAAEEITFYKEDGVTVDSKVTRTTTFNADGSVTVGVV